jgi:hypothetical protein
VRPDPLAYKSANGLVSPQRKVATIESFLAVINQNFDPMRVLISYQGDVEFGITFRRAVEGEEIVAKLDAIAQTADIGLSSWAMKDPDAISLGAYVEPAE